MKYFILCLAVIILSASSDNDCQRNSGCSANEKCDVVPDSSFRCIPDPVENADCSYISNCRDPEDCDAVALPGTRRERDCASNLFCRRVRSEGCYVIGICVTVGNARANEARCLRDQNTNASRCSADGDYKCSITEPTTGGNQVQTCYNTTSGRELRTFNPVSPSRVSEEKCRSENEQSCRTADGREVRSGDKIEDPDNRCSYCLCQNGKIDRNMCTPRDGCIQNPANCTHNGNNIPHDAVSNINPCEQIRCNNGVLSRPRDGNCDGKDDTDPCASATQSEREFVCAEIPSGGKQRIRKCKAMELGATHTDGRCGDEETCNCGRNETCTKRTDRSDICISADASGCRIKQCVATNESITCTTDETNRPVCSSSGVTYQSECEAFVKLDHNIKYTRACDASLCLDTNDGKGFCGYDNVTYKNLCELEMKAGHTMVDYKGMCRMDPGINEDCDQIPDRCEFATRASDAVCPVAGAQGVLYIDVEEAKDFAFRKGKSELTGRDLCEEALSDWEILTQLQLSDTSCEVTCRPKYDTVEAIIVQVTAVQGTDCVTCGDRLKLFIRKLREDKSGETITPSRRRRQTDDSENTGSGLFIGPSELANDPTYHTSGAMNLLSSLLLVLISLMLAFIVTSY